MDKVDFDAFVAARSTALLRTAYLLTRDHAQAEDLLQTALTKAWFSWRRISGEPEPYVRKILVNTYASWWGRKWNGEVATEELPEPGVADATDSTGSAHDLWQALGRLPRRQRAVVVLRYFEDLTETETARVLGCSVGNVKSQCSRALTKLRIDPALVTEEEL
ncbi:MAG TPA: SigE family RNA polymerase sigma factor [Nocardioides sp.]|nr:SigE family RNA polymerase sigma factor [Nocardioides sp.]